MEFETVIRSRALIVPSLSGGDDDPNGVCLLCPVCRHEWTHVREAYTIEGDDLYEGGGAYIGTVASNKGRNVTERRNALAVVIEGECGHRWELRLQQHKGHTILEFVRLEDENRGEADWP